MRGGTFYPARASLPLPSSFEITLAANGARGRIDKYPAPLQCYRKLVNYRVRRAGLAVHQDDSNGLSPGRRDQSRYDCKHRADDQYPRHAGPFDGTTRTIAKPNLPLLTALSATIGPQASVSR